jgi:biotin carboxyl carrier protein
MVHRFAKTYRFIVENTTHELTLFSDQGLYQVRLGDRILEVRARPISENGLLLEIDGRQALVYLAQEKGKRFVSFRGRQYTVEEAGPAASEGRTAQTQAFQADHALASPMPGQVVKIQVAEGDMVEKNQTVAIVEAMKMENELKASARARVKKIYAQAGDLVDAGQVIVELEPE